MSAPRPLLRQRKRNAFFAATLILAACGGPGAGYPDGSQVVAAQAEWCQALAKRSGAPDTWEHMSACKAAYPAASAAYLKGMVKCFTARLEAMGDKAPEASQIIAECNDEAIVSMPPDDAAGREVIEARCQRALRCEKVPVAECEAAVTKLEASQRALFTTTYNAKAQHTIAGCLSSRGCEDNEETARDACYKPQSDKLVWLPD
jgi:hypothetical protein